MVIIVQTGNQCSTFTSNTIEDEGASKIKKETDRTDGYKEWTSKWSNQAEISNKTKITLVNQ